MSRYGAVLAGLVLPWLISGASTAAVAGCRMELVSHLPLTPAHSHVTVPVVLDGKTAQMIFDTGAYTTNISLKAVQRLGLPPMRDEERDPHGKQGYLGWVGGIGGSRVATAVTAQTVDIGGLHGRNYNFIASDTDFPEADGLLSIDLISKFDVDLDFVENQIILYRAAGDCSAPAAFLSSPLYTIPLRAFGEDRRPRVNIVVNGQNVIAMIDTGASHTAIFRQTAERVGLTTPQTGPQPKQFAGGVGPRRVSRTRQTAQSVAIGDLEFNNMPVDVLDDSSLGEVEMLLGADFQRKVHLWISYSSHSLIMQYPPTASKKPA